MGILDNVSFLVIVAISSSVIADYVPNAYRQQVPQHSEALGFFNTTWEDIENFDLELCARHGGPGAYDIQKEAFSNLTTCMTWAYMEVLMEDADTNETPLSHHYRRNVFNKIHCRNLTRYDNCVEDFTQKIKICLDPKKHETTHIMYNSWKQVTRFMCKDNGAAITKVNRLRPDSCLRSKGEAMFGCVNQTFGEYLRATVPDGAAVGGLATIHLLEPNGEKCNVFQNLQNCAVEELKICPDQTSASLADSIFNIVKEVANCNRWLKSEASSHSVVNVALITILTTMYVQLF